jgi:hypothetical protein
METDMPIPGNGARVGWTRVWLFSCRRRTTVCQGHAGSLGKSAIRARSFCPAAIQAFAVGRWLHRSRCRNGREPFDWITDRLYCGHVRGPGMAGFPGAMSRLYSGRRCWWHAADRLITAVFGVGSSVGPSRWRSWSCGSACFQRKW